MTAPSTASLHGARDHARSQAGDGGDRPARDGRRRRRRACGTRRSAPAATPADELPRGTVLRIADARRRRLRAPRRATTPRDPAERLNVADTVKVQWQAYLGPGAVLLSDMGRVLMTIVADTSARHDALCGATQRARSTTARYGARRRSTAPTPSARELLVVAAAKHGLDAPRPADRASTCSSRRVVDDDGALRFDGDPRPGAAVELRAELDVIVLLANVPHPLDDRPGVHVARPVRAARRGGADPAADDPLRTSTPRAPAGVREHRRLPRRRCRDDGVVARRGRRGPRRVVRRRARRPGAAHRRPRRQPGRRLPALQRRRHRPSATRPPTRSPPRATSSSSPARCCAPTRAAR